MLYQQGTQRIEVVVKKEGGGLASVAGAKETDTDKMTTSGGETMVNNETSSGLSSRQKRIIKTNVTHGLAVIKQAVDLGIGYYIGGVGQRNGDQTLQDQVSRNFEVVRDVSNFASSVSMGILYGSAGGRVGAVLGGTFGAISSGMSTAVKYGNRQRDYDYKVFKENNAIEYNRARASISETFGRLR